MLFISSYLFKAKTQGPKKTFQNEGDGRGAQQLGADRNSRWRLSIGLDPCAKCHFKGSWASDGGSSHPAPGYGLAKTDRVCMSYVVRLCLMRVGMLGSKIIMGVLLDETLKEYSVI